MNAPSRDFMVRQAVLNAIEYLHPLYSKAWCASWANGSLPKPFADRIRAEYRILAARYEQAAA